VLSRWYLARQTVTLPQFASSTQNPKMSAVLVERAARMQAQIPTKFTIVPEARTGSTK